MYMDALYADFASLQRSNLLEQCRSYCRGAKIDDRVKSAILKAPQEALSFSLETLPSIT